MTKIATVALAGTFDVELSAKHHLELIDEAADAGAELVVFPEISLQGYPPDIDRFYPGRIADAFANAERVPDGPHVVAIAERARVRKTHVIFGLNELGDEAGVIYNTMVLTGPDGHIGSYRKVHVGITEQLTWRRGNDWPVFDTPFGKIGMLICYDKMWPESCRELTLRGADILVMSTAWGCSSASRIPTPTCSPTCIASSTGRAPRRTTAGSCRRTSSVSSAGRTTSA
jgi:predicted amidohydrolase